MLIPMRSYKTVGQVFVSDEKLKTFLKTNREFLIVLVCNEDTNEPSLVVTSLEPMEDYDNIITISNNALEYNSLMQTDIFTFNNTLFKGTVKVSRTIIADFHE